MGRHYSWLICPLATAATLVLAGCGAGSSASAVSSGSAASAGSAADSPDAATYRKGIEAQCAASTAFDRALPALAASQHLSEDEMLARIAGEGVKMRSAMARTTPPAELASAHKKLIADLIRLQAGVSGPMTAATAAAQAEAATAVLSDYRSVGATGCAAGEEKAVALLKKYARVLSGTPAATPS